MALPDGDVPDVDFDALERRYAEEKAKRTGAPETRRYIELKGSFAEFAADPFAGPDFVRDPVDRVVDVLVIGGGFGGLLAGVHLHKAGVRDIHFVEKAADFGGTWYWNRYPGVACDVESYIYMPLLEETGYVPTEKYAKGPEILAHCRRIANRFGFYDNALFRTEVAALNWDAARGRWIVCTDRGDMVAARFVISCIGLLSKPKLPKIPGIETFAGRSFHTSRWDFDYTGGGDGNGMDGLRDKRVGVIGTGSTGIQVVPRLAEWADRLYLFQRTPSSIDSRGNRPTDPEWSSALRPGWQAERIDNFAYWTSGVRQGEDLVADSWTSILSDAPTMMGGGGDDPEQAQRGEFRKMEKVRERVAAIVRDQTTAEALKPYFNYFCKRPCFSDEYLDAFNRPNVTLVDTAGRGVERITPGGVIVDGNEYPVDCLVYATGFDFMSEYTREAGFDIIGRDGVSLNAHWHCGARTLYGMQTRGFPNFFLMSLVQSGIGINYTQIADVQTRHIAGIVAHCLASDLATVEPTEEAEDAWVDVIVSSSGPRRAFLAACTPGYFNFEGERPRSLELNEPFSGGGLEYIRILSDWRRDGTMKGLEFGSGARA